MYIYIYIYIMIKSSLQKDCFSPEDQNIKNEAHSFYKNNIVDVACGNTLQLVLPYRVVISVDLTRLWYGVGNASRPRQSTYLGCL
jgi:hypothetical protein